MSLGGLFLATELGNDQEFPSFFEVFMQDRISLSLKPAIRHIFVVLAERYPRSIYLLDRFDEVFAFLSFLLERHYLSRGDALFSETLYGFRRSKFMNWKMTPLSARDRNKAIALHILAPYFKSKLDALFTQWTESSSSEAEPRNNNKYRKAFIAMYPLLHASYEGSFFIYQWAYLLGQTKHYSPLLHLLGMVLRRTTREDLERQVTATTNNTSLGNRVVRYLKVAVVLAIIAFKILEWWVAAPEILPQRKRIVPPVPDPPTAAPTGLSLPRDVTLCPLCQQPRINPAVSPAGIAYCYRCLLSHVRELGEFCPVTLQGCKEEQIRRIYLS